MTKETDMASPPGNFSRDRYVREKEEGMPKITVIIPSYNQSHILVFSLESLFTQKNVDFEVIIVDAGSEDYTPALIERYKDKIGRIFFVTRYDISLMINKGIVMASGEYFSVLFPGMEYMNPYALSRISRCLSEGRKPHLLYAPYLPSEKSHLGRKKKKIGRQAVLYPFHREWLKRAFFPSDLCSIWYRTDFVRSIGALHDRYPYGKGFLDLLCRIRKTPGYRAHITHRVVLWGDSLEGGRFRLWRDFFGAWVLIYKYFGFIDFLFFPFRDKPFYFISDFFQKVSALFKET